MAKMTRSLAHLQEIILKNAKLINYKEKTKQNKKPKHNLCDYLIKIES